MESGKIRSVKAEPDFKDTYDVIVIGLGTAGTEAALVSAALGLKTLGVEKENAMGGQSTIGCVWFQSKDTAAFPDPSRVLSNHHRDSGILKLSIPSRMYLYELEADEAELDITCETVVTGVYLDEASVKGVRLCRNGIACDIAARIVMDCTGNGTVARMAGCRMMVGRDFDHAQAAISKAMLQETRGGGTRPRYGFFRDDPSCSTEEYSRILLTLSCRWPMLWNGRGGRVLQMAAIPGMREEGHVVTEKFFTLRDCLMETPVSSPLFHTFVPLDLVRIDEDWAFENEDVQNWKALCGLNNFGFSATLPYETLLPEGVDSLLVPSKHFGVAHDAGSGIRMESDMRKTGYAAACVAYLSIRRRIPLRKIPYDPLKKLLDAGNILSPPRRRGVTLYSGATIKPFSHDDIVGALKRDIVPPRSWIFRAKNGPQEQSAFALASVWLAALRCSPEEKQVLAEKLCFEMRKKGRYAGNFAVALGLLGDRRACEVLRGIVKTPGEANPDGCDPVVPEAFPNRIKALCLLGRLHDGESIPLLKKIVQDEAKAFTADLPTGSASWKTQDQYRFAALSFALFSLMALLKRNPDPVLRETLLAWSRRPFVLPAGRDRFDCAPMLRRIITQSLVSP